MRNSLRYLKNVCNVILFNARYGNKLKMGGIETFENLRLKISTKVKIEIASHIHDGGKYLSTCNGQLIIGNNAWCGANVTILRGVNKGVINVDSLYINKVVKHIKLQDGEEAK